MAYSVLLLEDEKATRDYLVRLIEKHPELTLYKAVGDCAAARVALRHGEPDVLVADLGLPDGNGVDVIREARQRYPRLEAMVLTVFGDEDSAMAALEAGATGYLLKEQALKGLGDAILALKGGESAISPKVARYLLKRLNISVAEPEEVVSVDEQFREALEKSGLTDREHEILSMISRGCSYSEIGDLLHLSTHTVRAHTRNIFRKLAVHSRSEAVFEAINLGLISFPDQ